jgi:plastocyanin
MRRALTALALPLAVTAIAGCGSSGSSSSSASSSASTTAPTSTKSTASTPAPATGKTVQIVYQNIAIHPANITVKVGDKIKWVNKDNGIMHNVVTQSGPQQISSPNFTGGGSFETTAHAVGVVHYVCSIHPTAMIGTITITK